MPQFSINTVDDDRPNTNGRLASRVVLEVNGAQQAIQRINLESESAITRTARNWSSEFDINQVKVASELRKLGIEVMARVAERRQQRRAGPVVELRISDLMDEFLGKLNPEWHKKHRTIYFRDLGREVTLANLWTLANNVLIDRVADTVEAQEAARDGLMPNWRVRLAILKEAIRMAGARLITGLPSVADADQDSTLDEQNLLDALVAWLLAPRSFRTDNGTPVTTTFHSWAMALTPGAGWLPCFTTSIFGRIGEESGRPEICVKAEVLRTALNYETTRRMIGDLEASGYAQKKPIRVARCAWRVLKLDPKVLDSISSQPEVAQDACNP